jgi:hypothetical protein
LAAVLVAAFTCECGRQSAALPDVTQPADLVLSARPWDGWPLSISGLSVRVSGEIDGEAEVWAGDGAPQRVAGRVDWSAPIHDWFSPSCHFHYRPKNVSAGRLVVCYEFE